MKKHITKFIDTVFPETAQNAIYNPNDFIKVLLEASQKNKFLEGACEDVDGACDAETIFDKLKEICPDDLYEIFISLVKPQLTKVIVFPNVQYNLLVI